jgi:hypothetical protein
MVESTIPEPVDCVLVFLGSFYIKNDEELRTHLKSVANSLRSRGLYLLDGVVSYFADDVRTQSWQESRDGITVALEISALRFS